MFKTVKMHEYTYTALFEFDKNTIDHKDLVIFLTGKAMCPTLKLDRFVFEFGDCPLKSNRELVMKMHNINEEKPVDIQFQQNPYFQFKPT